MINRFGIMQGRLILPHNGELQCFPDKCWRDEFLLADSLGLDFIELMIDEEFNPLNPLWEKESLFKVKDISNVTQRKIYSICNNYIITHSILDNIPVIEKVKNLIIDNSILNFRILVLPFYGKSEMRNDNIKLFKNVVTELCLLCQKYNILLCIEANVEAKTLLSFIEDINLHNLGVVYDIGNRIIFNGISIEKELKILDKRIFHIHIKDKNNLNENVFLGTGLVNFRIFFKLLNQLNYQGKYVFESVRGENPIKTLKYNMDFCKFFLEEK